MQFIDQTKFYIKAGNGGDGIIAFRREAHVEFGGPFGGDGGRGADIIFVGDHNMNTLFKYRYTRKIVAPNGDNGHSKKMAGRGSEDKIIPVPIGTIIKNDDTGEIIYEVLRSGEKVVIARGGKGGKGNARFASHHNPAPRMNERGDLGEEFNISLELKVLADAGLVGMPNAGKSTLISTISNAKPQIAPYPFTTLSPVLGVVKLSGDREMIISDIPGLIEGASDGKGLGIEFLRHVERCKVLIQITSLDPIDGNPIENFRIVKNELEKYKNLSLKPIIHAFSKSDEFSDVNEAENIKEQLGIKNIFIFSSLTREGINELMEETYRYVKKELEENLNKQAVSEHKIYTIKEADLDNDPLIVKVEQPGTFIVESERLKYWTHKIPLTTKENMMRYNQKLKTLGVEEYLKKEFNAKKGDTLKIYTNDLLVD